LKTPVRPGKTSSVSRDSSHTHAILDSQSTPRTQYFPVGMKPNTPNKFWEAKTRRWLNPRKI